MVDIDNTPKQKEHDQQLQKITITTATALHKLHHQ